MAQFLELIQDGTHDNRVYGTTQGRTNASTHASLVTYLGLNSSNYYTLGLYWDLDVPKGAIINSAYLNFYCWSTASATSVESDIYAEAVDDASPLTTLSSFTGLTPTSASVTWSPGSWTYDNRYDSDDIKDVIQEIVNRSGWVSGNGINLIVEATSNATTWRWTRDYSNNTAQAVRLEVNYTSVSNDNVTLFLTGAVFQNDNMSLFADGIGVENENASLFLKTEPPSINTYAPLHEHGHESDNSNATLFMPVPLGSVTDDIDLFTEGHIGLNSYMRLMISGAVPVNNNASLYIDGVGVTNKIEYLYIKGHLYDLNTYAPLLIPGGTAGWFTTTGSMPLYMGPPGTWKGAPLFIKNTEPYVEANAARYLFIEGSAWPASGSIPLVTTGPDGTTGALTLFIRTPSGFKNAVPTGRGAPLFINRPDESTWLPLFLKALDNPVNSYIPLHIRSTIASNDNITLAIPDVTQGLNTFIALSTTGIVIETGDIDLFVGAHGVLNGTAPLTLWQNTGYPNSYASLYVMGAYLLNNNMNLVIPSVVDEPTGSFPIYIFGW